jgi:propionate CoA-transferase
MDEDLVIVQEGREKKFIAKVDQITFNGAYAAETGQTVYFVTERCVFRRTKEGMELIEVAPGINIERDILGQMEFVPIIREPKIMDLRLFQTFPMHLDETLLGLGVSERLSYDAKRNTMFFNWEGLHMRTRDDVDRVRRAIEELCQSIGRKVNFVANYDGFRIESGVEDTYAAMVRYLETHYYLTASRYTTSAFLRLKLGAALERRKVAPHIFETSEEASAFIETDAGTASASGVAYQFLNHSYDE